MACYFAVGYGLYRCCFGTVSSSAWECSASLIAYLRDAGHAPCLQDPNFVSDAYAECYPSYHALGTEIVESDDEDLGHMDAKARTCYLAAVWASIRRCSAHV